MSVHCALFQLRLCACRVSLPPRCDLARRYIPLEHFKDAQNFHFGRFKISINASVVSLDYESSPDHRLKVC